MERLNSNSPKRQLQTEIFTKYATYNVYDEPVLDFDSFIKLVSDSNSLTDNLTDHSYNLNTIPKGTFGCIFFAVDEKNKGYLTINDWFHFNNLLELNNFNYIILYEFFRKFDQLKYPTSNFLFPKSINYNQNSLSFDTLFLTKENIIDTLDILHDEILNLSFLNPIDKSNFEKNFILNWKDLDSNLLTFYQQFYFNPIQTKTPLQIPIISLNSILTIIQTELPNIRLKKAFKSLSNYHPKNNNLIISIDQLNYILKIFYIHRISIEFFDSLKNIKNLNNFYKNSNKDSIDYNTIKDLSFLIQNFDLINQILIKFIKINNLNEYNIKNNPFTKFQFINFINNQYNKVNNITFFTPSQIDLLFNIVESSKKVKNLNKWDPDNAKNLESSSSFNAYNNLHHHQIQSIDDYISNEFIHNSFNSDNTLKPTSPTSTTLSSRPTSLSTTLTLQDFMKILNPNYLNDLIHQLELNKIQSNSIYINYYFYPIFNSIYNFSLGSIAGCIGATFVYPIDLIKTRLQAQRDLSKYKNSFDCLIKILKVEGPKGLYSGLSPQLIGVAPEKAIKLTVNDKMRFNLKNWNNGKLTLPLEVISGACAGTCQVIFTNPLEIVKIRLQVKSEYANENLAKSQITAIQIVKKLGLSGLYRGVTACLLRDVPFSAIYFPTYAHLKKNLFNFNINPDPIIDDPTLINQNSNTTNSTTNNNNSNPSKFNRSRLKTWELLVAGGLAGIPAAFLTTPMDVIKTRLQMDPKKGETKYKGVFDAVRTILREESYKSFFKGSTARVLRSSPQFGVTLAAYELFKQFFPLKNDEETNKISNKKQDFPKVVDSFTEFSKNYAKSSSSNNTSTEFNFFAPNVDPYGNNYINYYYKCCQAAKIFIDLDTMFGRFDKNVYNRFQKEINSISQETSKD
ncbi:hypothetical protein TBLA_0G02760 [Henningerozyma blattae CBS 6284]|uniref:Mitochondrial aspartate-glutamate transporter AGC1 n=1 Tax=Henningerozyma blattae (strain ATCC 34711 / CBS 6284 / DSM 70876 / NBRC 10599 / NRRL Y-10934 / UCD 77-7) TaxID=1071380 RepID=I2H762_HENB6|nr:hypothetical protein TBLA_0G02760 [Tetrapisispora blattae CBS 6284]CCH62214.1 hypothetical protein TBLA_0G02760 [Tetrapisispora blattae CBS 6284]